MPKTKKETVTYKKIAEAFGLTTETLRQWRISKDVRMNRRYEALRVAYITNLEY